MVSGDSLPRINFYDAVFDQDRKQIQRSWGRGVQQVARVIKLGVMTRADEFPFRLHKGDATTQMGAFLVDGKKAAVF